MKTINISEYNIIHDVPPLMSLSDRCAIDTEFSQMDGKKLHRPTGIFACATFYAGGKDVWIVEDVRDLATAMQNVEQAGWIYHNAVFDIFQLRRYIVVPQRTKIWDTQLVEQVRFSGRYKEFNLAACCRRNLDLLLEKDERDTFEAHEGEMTQSQVEYACKDPIATYQLYFAQRKNMDADDLRVWKENELPYMWVVLGKAGMPINAEAWTKLAETNKERMDIVQSKYGKKVYKIGKKGQVTKSFTWEGISLGSPQQVLANLNKLGFGVESTGKKILKQLEDAAEAEENGGDGIEIDGLEFEFVKDLVEFRKYAVRCRTYGMNWLNTHLEADEKVYPSILQREAGTSRSSSRNPNGQNIPHRDTNEFRECFIAGEGYKLVIADYSSQEPRLAAQFSQDENLIGVFQSGKDVYIESARVVFGEEIDKKSPRRKNMKDLTLATIYGKGRNALAKDMKVSPDVAQDMLNAFDGAYPKIKTNYVHPTQNFAKEHEYVKTVNGAKLWVNVYEGGGKSDRTAVNYPIQGSGAEMVKEASFKFEKAWDGERFYDNLAFLMPVHDEIILCVKEDKAEEARALLVKTMIETAQRYHPSVPAAVESFVADTWAEKS